MAPTGGAGLICLAWEEAGVHRVRRPAGACHPFNQRKEMALTIVETPITGGVDTHADVHVAAALDPVGGLLGVAEFPVTPAGYARLLGWLSGFGTVCLVGIEGTGSYGAGLARHVATAGIRVVEVGPLRPPGPAPAGQVRPAGRRQRRPGRAVRPGPRRAERPGRLGGGDPRADGSPGAAPAPSGPRPSTRPGP